MLGPTTARWGARMTSLIAAAAFFLLIHFAVSGTRLRQALAGKLGEGPYMGLFSLASVAGLAWLILAFGQARGGPGLWAPTPATRNLQLVLQLVAMLFIIA